MKVKYLRLNKEERKEARDKFFATEQGIKSKKSLNRSLICSILCMLFSIYLLIDAFKNTHETFDYIYGVCIAIISIMMFMFYLKIRVTVINNYLTKPNNNKKKK